jgi:hypothetical protein
MRRAADPFSGAAGTVNGEQLLKRSHPVIEVDRTQTQVHVRVRF